MQGSTKFTLSDDYEPTYIGFLFVFVSGTVALLIALLVWARWDSSDRRKPRSRASNDGACENTKNEHSRMESRPNIIRKKDSKQPKWKSDKGSRFEHPLLFTTLKGHVNDVIDIDFSSNGKYLASISTDRSLFLWTVKDFSEREHKLHRTVMELDHANHILFAPDSKSVILSLGVGNKLVVYKITKKGGTQSYKFVPVESVEFPTVHSRDINSIGIACNGRFAMSSSENNEIIIYNIRGEVLKIISPKLNILYKSLITPCGRFVASCGFTPDVFVSEVLFDREGSFQDVKRAFDLKGHTSGIYSIAFDQSSSKCVTASKDGTWHVFNTDIRYALGEEAKIIARGEWEALRTAAAESVHVAVTPSGRSFAISAGRSIHLFSMIQPTKVFDIISDVHEQPIAALKMSPCGRMLATCADRHIRVFHNVAELFSDVAALELAITETREDTRRRRLNEQLDEAKDALNNVMSI